MIRHAKPADYPAIRDLTTAAFGQKDEADLIERLRASEDKLLELVADEAGEVLGHIMFSKLYADSIQLYAALAPLAVRPDKQRTGVGGRLIQTGLESAKDFGAHGVLVLGHPEYYPRFGFTTGATEKVKAPYSGNPNFMAIALEAGALDHPLLVAYPDAFAP